MNVKPAGHSVVQAVAFAVATLGAVVLMTACGAKGDDEVSTSAAPQRVNSASVEPSVAADGAMGDGAMGDGEATGEALPGEASDIEIFAYAYASVKDPEPTWELEDQVVVFTFPSGEVDAESNYDCLIAVNVFGQDHPDGDLRMTYPDGSVLCSEMDP